MRLYQESQIQEAARRLHENGVDPDRAALRFAHGWPHHPRHIALRQPATHVTARALFEIHLQDVSTCQDCWRNYIRLATVGVPSTSVRDSIQIQTDFEPTSMVVGAGRVARHLLCDRESAWATLQSMLAPPMVADVRSAPSVGLVVVAGAHRDGVVYFTRRIECFRALVLGEQAGRLVLPEWGSNDRWTPHYLTECLAAKLGDRGLTGRRLVACLEPDRKDEVSLVIHPTVGPDRAIPVIQYHQALSELLSAANANRRVVRIQPIAWGLPGGASHSIADRIRDVLESLLAMLGASPDRGVSDALLRACAKNDPSVAIRLSDPITRRDLAAFAAEHLVPAHRTAFETRMLHATDSADDVISSIEQWLNLNPTALVEER